jgi:hypothetical protein
MTIKNNFLKICLFAAFSTIAAFLASCNEEPTGLGKTLLPDTVALSVLDSDTSEIITEYNSYFNSSVQVNSSGLLIGKTKHSIANSMCRFGVPDSMDWLEEANIKSVELIIEPWRYVIGDSVNANFGFKIYKVMKPWDVVNDSLRYDDIFGDPSYLGEELASYNQVIPLKDTMEAITIQLPPSILPHWLQTRDSLDEDGEFVRKILTDNDGIAFVADENCNIIQSFRAYGGLGMAEPLKIKAAFTNRDGEDDTLELESSFDAFFPKYIRDDKIEFGYQNGLNLQSQITLSVNKFPNRAAVHRAVMELKVNMENSEIGNFGPSENFQAVFIRPDDETDSLEIDFFLDEEAGDIYRGDMRVPVKYLNDNDLEGRVILRSRPLTQSGTNFEVFINQLDIIAFYPPEAEEQDKKPRTKIIYSVNSIIDDIEE